jgi:hypothetical protein
VDLLNRSFQSALKGDPFSIIILSVMLLLAVRVVWGFLKLGFLFLKPGIESAAGSNPYISPEGEYTRAEQDGLPGILLVVKPLVGILLVVSILFGFTAYSNYSPRGLLFIVFAAFVGLLLIPVIRTGVSSSRTGPCPSCHRQVTAIPKNNTIICPSCSKRIIVDNLMFWATPDKTC